VLRTEEERRSAHGRREKWGKEEGGKVMHGQPQEGRKTTSFNYWKERKKRSKKKKKISLQDYTRKKRRALRFLSPQRRREKKKNQKKPH